MMSKRKNNAHLSKLIFSRNSRVGVKPHVRSATTMRPASLHETTYLPYLAIASCHTKDPIKKVYADKGYYGKPNRLFLNLNDIEDGIMHKDMTTAKITEIEIERNKRISKKRYIWAAMCR